MLEETTDITFIHPGHYLECGLVHIMPQEGTGSALAPQSFVKMIFSEHPPLLRRQRGVCNPFQAVIHKYFTYTVACHLIFLYRLNPTPT